MTDDDNNVYSIHFVALFSTNLLPVPIAFFHGWPGSFLSYPTADELPYHVTIPSLPGYAFSASPPEDKDWTYRDSARLMHKLLCDLGFNKSGYMVQGGDIDSVISRTPVTTYLECNAMHINFNPMLKPDGVVGSAVNGAELRRLERLNA